MRRCATGLPLLVMMLLGADHAFAQAAFVQGGFVIDVRRFSGAPDQRVFDANTPAIVFGGGGFLTSMISAGVEVDLGGESEVTDSSTITIAGRPEVVTTTFTSRRRSVSALFGIHSPPARVVRVGAFAGLAFTAFDQRIATDAPPIVLSSPPPPAEFGHRAATPIVGVDIAIAISPNLSVVGVVRAQSMDFGGELRGFSIRPGAAVRVIF
jgi:hypothetical protein